MMRKLSKSRTTAPAGKKMLPPPVPLWAALGEGLGVRELGPG